LKKILVRLFFSKIAEFIAAYLHKHVLHLSCCTTIIKQQ